jgi:hypothetical protein
MTAVTGPAGNTGADPAVLHRRAFTALVANLVVAVLCFGLLSVPGAFAAGMALRALPADPPRAERLVRWSWALMAANLIFYVLLAAVVLTVVVLIYLARRRA